MYTYLYLYMNVKGAFRMNVFRNVAADKINVFFFYLENTKKIKIIFY